MREARRKSNKEMRQTKKNRMKRVLEKGEEMRMKIGAKMKTMKKKRIQSLRNSAYSQCECKLSCHK